MRALFLLIINLNNFSMHIKILIVTIIFFISAVTWSQEDPNGIPPSHKFSEVISYINQMYVDDVDDEELTNTAIVALLEELDPHSVYLKRRGQRCK